MLEDAAQTSKEQKSSALSSDEPYQLQYQTPKQGSPPSIL